MTAKQAETEFARMCARMNIWCHKWQDVRYCPNCRKPIFQKRTSENDERPREQQESIVDYLIFVDNIPIWVECKGKGGETRFAFRDLNQQQRNFLDSWVKRGTPCYLFITLGDGKAPKGRNAWLIDYAFWYERERAYVLNGMKSLPWMYAGRKGDYFDFGDFDSYKLAWDSGWMISKDHALAYKYPGIFSLPSLFELEPT